MTLVSFIAVRTTFLDHRSQSSTSYLLDLKPENLLFRTPAEDADIMIADFGLSRVMDDHKLTQLTEICGTPGVRSVPPISRHH